MDTLGIKDTDERYLNKMKYKIDLARVLIILILIGVVSCTPQNTPEDTVSNVNVGEVRDLVMHDKTVVVLDVRTPEEYARGHIEGALNINIANSGFSDSVSNLDREKTYIVHCAANANNGRAAESLGIMRNHGFEKLLNMQGGIIAWQESAYPLVQSDKQ